MAKKFTSIWGTTVEEYQKSKKDRLFRRECMGVFRVALTWIRRNMYVPRNTTKSSVWSWGVTGEARELTFHLVTQACSFHVPQVLWVWRAEMRQNTHAVSLGLALP